MYLKGKWHTLTVMKFAPPQGKRRSKSKRMPQKWRCRVEKRRRRVKTATAFAVWKCSGGSRSRTQRGGIPGRKENKKGKSGEWHPEGGKPLAQVEEAYGRRIQYTTQTAREREWGLLNRQEEWEHGRYLDPNNWELSSGEWRWGHQKGK